MPAVPLIPRIPPLWPEKKSADRLSRSKAHFQRFKLPRKTTSSRDIGTNTEDRRSTMKDGTRSDCAESAVSSDDSARLSTCSTLADVAQDSFKSDLRGGFMIPHAEKDFKDYDWKAQRLSESGNVFEYLHPATKQLKVVKQARDGEPDTHRRRALENEVKFYKLLEDKKLTSPMILQFHKAEQDSRGLHLHLQSMEQGSIKDRIERLGGIELGQVRRYTRCVASALAYLHELRIIWNGCGADHVLLDSEGNPKISGFGSFRRRNRDGKFAHLNPEEIHRRLRWMAPEAVRKSTCSKQTDVWGLGCLVVEMVSREDPHLDCTTGTQVAQKLERSIDPRPPVQEQGDKSSRGDLLSFLDSIFATKPSGRLSAKCLLRESLFLSLEPRRSP